MEIERNSKGYTELLRRRNSAAASLKKVDRVDQLCAYDYFNLYFNFTYFIVLYTFFLHRTIFIHLFLDRPILRCISVAPVHQQVAD